jgi:hypothetical protein
MENAMRVAAAVVGARIAAKLAHSAMGKLCHTLDEPLSKHIAHKNQLYAPIALHEIYNNLQ